MAVVRFFPHLIVWERVGAGSGLGRDLSRSPTPGGLDLDDVRPEIAQDSGRQGSGPDAGEVDDANTLQWSVVESTVRLDRLDRLGRPAADQVRDVFAARMPGRRWAAVEQEGPTGKSGPGFSVASAPEAALPKMGVLEDLAQGRHGSDGRRDSLPHCDDLVGGVLEEPGLDRLVELPTMLGAAPVLGEAFVLHQVAESGRFEEGLQHHADGKGECHPTVFAPIVTDGVPGAALPVSHPLQDVVRLGPHHGRVLMQARETLQVADFDCLASAQSISRAQRRQCADESEDPGLMQCRVAGAADRFAVRLAVEKEVPPGGLIGDLVRAPAAVRPGETVGRDVDLDEVWGFEIETARRQWIRRRALDDDVGAG